MTETRIAVLVGGPHDGKGLLVADNTPWIHMPAREVDILVSLANNDITDMAYEVASYSALRMHWRGKTKVIIYEFDGMIR